MNTSLLVASKYATTTVNTTTADTALGVLSLPSSGLGRIGRAARFTAAGDLLSNTGSPETVIFKFKLGVTTVLTTPAVALAADVDRKHWWADILVVAVSLTTQRIAGSLQISDAESGTWVDGNATGVVLTGYGTAAEDAGTILACTLSVTFSASSASLEATCKTAILELLR